MKRLAGFVVLVVAVSGCAASSPASLPADPDLALCTQLVTDWNTFAQGSLRSSLNRMKDTGRDDYVTMSAVLAEYGAVLQMHASGFRSSGLRTVWSEVGDDALGSSGVLGQTSPNEIDVLNSYTTVGKAGLSAIQGCADYKTGK